MKLEIITTHIITDFSALNTLLDISPRKVRPAHPGLKKWQEAQKSRSKFHHHVNVLTVTRSLHISKFADKPEKVSPSLRDSPIVTCVRLGHLSPFCTSFKTTIKKAHFWFWTLHTAGPFSWTKRQYIQTHTYNARSFACCYMFCEYVFE